MLPHGAVAAIADDALLRAGTCAWQPGRGLNECSNPKETSGLRVYPPNQKAALFAPSTEREFCSSDKRLPLTVYPFGDDQFG
jgi:hypothetical protein